MRHVLRVAGTDPAPVKKKRQLFPGPLPVSPRLFVLPRLWAGDRTFDSAASRTQLPHPGSGVLA